MTVSIAYGGVLDKMLGVWYLDGGKISFPFRFENPEIGGLKCTNSQNHAWTVS